MPTIPFSEWYKRNKLKKRDAYRWLKDHETEGVKELRAIVQTRKQWVLCIEESVKP